MREMRVISSCKKDVFSVILEQNNALKMKSATKMFQKLAKNRLI